MGTFVEIQHHTCMDRQQHDAKVNDGYNIRYVFLRVLDLLNSHGNNVSLGSLLSQASKCVRCIRCITLLSLTGFGLMALGTGGVHVLEFL